MMDSAKYRNTTSPKRLSGSLTMAGSNSPFLSRAMRNQYSQQSGDEQGPIHELDTW